MDVTFKVALEMEMSKHGVVVGRVKPIAVPQPNGSQSCLNASIEPFSS